MANPDSENPKLVRQHVEKNRKGDDVLQHKPGKPTHQEGPQEGGNWPGHADPNDRTPPHAGDPEQVENVPGREPHNPDRRPDPQETDQSGKRGRKYP